MAKQKAHEGRHKRHLVIHSILFLLCVLIMLPIVFTFFYSFFPTSEMDSYMKLRGQFDERFMPILVSPKMFSLRQYYTILIEDQTYLRLFFNSVFYTISILIGQALVIPAFAYALSRFRFRGRELLFFIILILMLMPFQVLMTPNLYALRMMNLLNTPWAVILPMCFSPFYIFLLRQFMVSVPGDMFEAGMMDGAGIVRSFFYIQLPVCRPVMGAAIALSFADSWNMVEQPLEYLKQAGQNAMPLSVMFNTLSTEKAGIAFAGAAFYIVPMLLIYFYFQEDILLGVQLSELK